MDLKKNALAGELDMYEYKVRKKLGDVDYDGAYGYKSRKSAVAAFNRRYPNSMPEAGTSFLHCFGRPRPQPLKSMFLFNISDKQGCKC